MLAFSGIVRLVRPDEWGINPFLAEVNVLFLGLPCRFCLCDGFFFLLDVLRFEGNWLAALLVGIDPAEAQERA